MADYTGEIRNTYVPYYDRKTHSTKFKARPMLLIQKIEDCNNSDYTALPVSKVSIKRNLNEKYDVEIKKVEFPGANLSCDISYIRTHKLVTITNNKIDKAEMVCDFCEEYPEKYEEVILKTQEYIAGIKKVV